MPSKKDAPKRKGFFKRSKKEDKNSLDVKEEGLSPITPAE